MTKKWVKIKIGIQDTYNTGINNFNDSIYCLSCLFTNFSNNFGITCSLCLLVDGHYLHVRINHIYPITHCIVLVFSCFFIPPFFRFNTSLNHYYDLKELFPIFVSTFSSFKLSCFNGFMPQSSVYFLYFQ